MKLDILDIGGEVVKDDDRYVVKDNVASVSYTHLRAHET